MQQLTHLFLVACTTAMTVNAVAQPAAPDLTDAEILALCEGLRVADVSDGMDALGLRDIGLMDTRIQPLWKDIDHFEHQFTGIAVTARYVPHNQVVPQPENVQDFEEWKGRWYKQVSPVTFTEHINEGTVLVIDASGDGDTGSIGSENSLRWVERGARGIVTTGSVRDTDEIAKQRVPIYLDPLKRGRGIRPGRNMLESVQEPVEVGGVYVRPGDIIVADGDGVIVVPREYARPVAEYAQATLIEDKAKRRAAYERLGRELDETVRQ